MSTYHVYVVWFHMTGHRGFGVCLDLFCDEKHPDVGGNPETVVSLMTNVLHIC
jgi:hypothetical protein